MADVNNLNAKLGQQNIDSNVYNYYGDKKIKKFFGVLPFFTETFLGREEDIKAVRQKLFDGNNLLLLVNGEGGIGKTTLAARYYLQYQDDYEHLAWVYVATNLTDALLTLAIPLDIGFADNATAEERMRQLLDELRNLKRPCLLVIDNANELKDLEANYAALHSCTSFHLLLTTRITEFEQVPTYKIDPLEKADAVELFKKYYSRHKADENDLLEGILTAVGYNTLVIELLAKNLDNLNELKTHYSLAQLLKDLQEKGLLALSYTHPVSTRYQVAGIHLRKEKPEAIIEAMYDLSGLAKEETTLLSVFAVLPAEKISFETLEVLLPGGNMETPLLSLAQKGWLDYDGTDRSFKVSPVVQDIMKNKNPDLADDCRGLVNGLIQKLDYQPGTGHFLNCSYEEATVFVRYAESFLSKIHHPNEDIAILCERVGRFFLTIGNVEQALTYYEDFNRLIKGLHDANPQNMNFKEGLAISYSKLGDTQAALGNLGQALAYYEDETRFFEELYNTNPQNVGFKNGLAISYSKLGQTQATLGNLGQALAYYEDFNRLIKGLHDTNPQNVGFKNGLAISYSRFGETQAALGNLEQALAYYEDYNCLEKELYDANPQKVDFKNGLAVSYSRLGDTQAALGNLEQALAYYEKDTQLSKELYDANPQNVDFKNGLAISFIKLGLLQEQNDNKENAKESYKIAEKHYLELVAKSPAYADFKKNLQWVQNKLAELEGR